MTAKAKILIIICLLFLVGTVAAVGIPDSVTINSSKSYLTANNVDQSTLTVIVSNTTTDPGPVMGAGVDFLVLNPALGTINPLHATTDINGKATSTFKVKTKSGVADIRVNVTGSNIFNTMQQRIDHDKPNKVVFVPPYEGTVGTIVAFNTAFTDQWGNPIDNQINLNQSHIITLHVHGPSPDDCNFVDVNNISLGHDLISTPLDANGSVPVRIKLTSGIGSNYISMEAFDISPPPKVIKAIPGLPFFITQEFNPDGTPPKLPAGGSFTFVYTFYDKFMNPAGGQNVWVNTSSRNLLIPTQENGKISGTYSELITGLYTITATAVNNNSVTASKIVQFYNATATSHNVLANPQTMPSRDVNADIYSNISARVVDDVGNGVNGQTVTFTLSGLSYTPTTVGSTLAPSFSKTNVTQTISAITGADGIDGVATVKFYPGAFVTTGINYSQSATGNGKITATWNSIPKVVDIAWKNYAYLSATLKVTPPQVKVGETVDVNLKLNGDGWNLVRKPIDVMLVIDKSGSMAWNTPTEYDSHSSNPTRISSAKTAAITFVEEMKDGNNQVGLVSFASTTTTDRSLTNDFNGVQNNINNLNANGATQMRRALYEGITDVDTYGRNGTVKAVILLTDGDWNYDGSILGHGTGWPIGSSGYTFSGNTLEPDNYRYYDGLGGTLTGSPQRCTNGEFTSQNMSIYAKENNIRIYALSFVNQPSTYVQGALTTLATNTGGFYQHAPDESALNALYTTIATQLKEDAGIDTSADMDFGHLILDDQLIDTSTPGNATFDYVGDPIIPGINPGNSYTTAAPGSTMVRKYNITTELIPGPDFTQPGPWIVNQTPEWNDNKSLNFNIGLVKLGDTWETNFRLRVLQEGTILLFNPDSRVTFKDSDGVYSSLTLKNLSYFTAVAVPAGLEIQKIDVNLTCPSQLDNTTPIMPLSWVTTYEGQATTIYEEGRYMSESGAWVIFYSNHYNVGGNESRSRSTTFDLRKVMSGKYTLNIKSYTTGSKATASPTCGPYLYSTEGIRFIRLN